MSTITDLGDKISMVFQKEREAIFSTKNNRQLSKRVQVHPSLIY